MKFFKKSIIAAVNFAARLIVANDQDCWRVGTNRWHKDRYSAEEALLAAINLVECSHCIDCTSCVRCRDCVGCTDCADCIGCVDCLDCSHCADLKDEVSESFKKDTKREE